MKRITCYLMALFAAITTIVSCNGTTADSTNNNSNGNNPNEISVTGTATDITEFTAKITGYANKTDDLGYVTMGIVVSTDENPTFDNGMRFTSQELDDNNMYTVHATGLAYNTVYYYKSFVLSDGVSRSGKVKTFTTRDFSISISASASDVTGMIADLSGKLTVDSVDDLEKSVWFLYGKYQTLEELKSQGSKQTAKLAEDGSFSANVTDLDPGAKYYYVAGGKVHDKEVYSELGSFTTGFGKISAVDMGLSVKWANANIGASKPEEYGAYFAWGETETKTTYDWNTYKWCNGSSSTLTKYNNRSSYGTVDNKTVLESEDDVAHVKLGGKWRIPTDEEWTELRENCTWTWTTQNGVNGRLVTSKKNGNSIFLPAAGGRDDGSLYGAGSYGYYWSASLNTGYPIYAWYVYFYSDDVYRDDYGRCYGQSVRPVTE